MRNAFKEAAVDTKNEGISVHMAALDVLVLGPERAGSPSRRGWGGAGGGSQTGTSVAALSHLYCRFMDTSGVCDIHSSS